MSSWLMVEINSYIDRQEKENLRVTWEVLKLTTLPNIVLSGVVVVFEVDVDVDFFVD